VNELPVNPLILAPVKCAAGGSLAWAFPFAIDHSDPPLRAPCKGLHYQVPVAV
jgi:hypothetical protein